MFAIATVTGIRTDMMEAEIGVAVDAAQMKLWMPRAMQAFVEPGSPASHRGVLS